jgi:solute carrier family 8 (sodium/calcium exchanger)
LPPNYVIHSQSNGQSSPGSSAPEILLAVIGIVGNNFEAEKLGPSTIVGSASFNLLAISAVCIYGIPDGEIRRIKNFPVFIITATASIFAYVWLIIILVVVSKVRWRLMNGPDQ